MLASSPARSRLKVWRSNRAPPASIARPSPSRLVPMMEPVICARTIAAPLAVSTKKASSSSAMLPKLMVSSPPMAAPAWAATCSVACRTQSASTATAIAPVTNTQIGPTGTK